MESIQKGIYRHSKGGLYEVIGIIFVEGIGQCVAYFSGINGKQDDLGRTYGLWYRPANMWSEFVENPFGEGQITRFTKVDYEGYKPNQGTPAAINGNKLRLFGAALYSEDTNLAPLEIFQIVGEEELKTISSAVLYSNLKI